MSDQAPTPAPNRRWFRFSLRGLLVLATACAVITPLVPPTVARIAAWLHPPKTPGTVFRMVMPRGGTWMDEEEELLGASPDRASPH